MPADSMIQITVNGEALDAPTGISIPDFLNSQNLHPDRVVVEWNGQAQTRDEAAGIRLSDGDRLEVVRIVAGG